VAALLIYSTIYPRNDRLHAVLSSRPLGYLAKTSYALYVVHPLSYAGWLGEGDVVIRYAKRMISFVLTFAVAHFSTAYYEKYWNELGHRLAARVEHKARRGGMF
jgi:peptidoglycan/LPS O-acetylase OafA/YrhL